MRLYLLMAETIAHAPIVLSPTMNTIIASSTESSSAVAKAAREQLFFFIAYVLVLLLSAGLTVMLWRSGNKYQSAIKADAEARIETVKADALTESRRIEQQGMEAIERVRADSAERIAKAKSDADIKIAETKERTAQLEKQALALQEQNLATESKLTEAKRILEKEKAIRLELEKSLAPRSFEIKVTASPNSNFEELKPFGGTNVIFEVLTDSEARRAANEIGNLVGFAGWKVVSVNSNPELWSGFFDGVSIVPPSDFSPGFAGQVDGNKLAIRRKTTRAAEALTLWLIDQNWKASVRNNIPEVGELPDDTIKIFIGFKPNPFFEPDWVKDMEKIYEKILKEQKRRQEEMDKLFPPPSQNQD
jgi:hypothetical protein